MTGGDGPSDHGGWPADDGDEDVARLLLSGVRERLDEPRTLSLDEVGRRAGVDLDVLTRLFDAAGRRHDTGRYGERDVVYASCLAELSGRFDVEVLERALRLNQRAVVSMAVNQLALVQADRRLAPLLEGEVDTGLVDVLANEARLTFASVQRLLVEDHQLAVLRLLDSEVVVEASRTLGEVLDVAVAFVDLVGFTRLSATAEPGIVGATLGAFEDVAHEEVARVGEVLVVKFIGDAVMLLGGEADRVADAAMGIVESEVEGLAQVARRAGLGAGEVQVRGGDYVGTPINAAARLTDLARPGTLVATEEAAGRLGDRWRTSQMGALRVKGLGRLRPLRVRREQPPSTS